MPWENGGNHENLREDNRSSEEIRASPSSPSSAESRSDPQEQPYKKKKRIEEPARGKTQTAEGKTSISGEPGASSGGLDDEDSSEIPSSLLDLYLKDTLEAAQES
ncbi:hypothetical protein Esti_006601 [Eimeria stiedai]